MARVSFYGGNKKFSVCFWFANVTLFCRCFVCPARYRRAQYQGPSETAVTDVICYSTEVQNNMEVIAT